MGQEYQRGSGVKMGEVEGAVDRVTITVTVTGTEILPENCHIPVNWVFLAIPSFLCYLVSLLQNLHGIRKNRTSFFELGITEAFTER